MRVVNPRADGGIAPFDLTGASHSRFLPSPRRGGGGEAAPLQLTNAQKLLLLPDTAPGTLVTVTDAFLLAGLSGDDYSLNGLWIQDGEANGKPSFRKAQHPSGGDFGCYFNGSAWVLSSDLAYYEAPGDVAAPWLADWGALPTAFQQPAQQVLATPSNAVVGIFVLGGNPSLGLTGIYLDAGLHEGKRWYQQLGVYNSGTPSTGSIASFSGAWFIQTQNGANLLSAQDVEFPWLVTDWTNGSTGEAVTLTWADVIDSDLKSGFLISGAGTTASNFPAGMFDTYAAQAGRLYYINPDGTRGIYFSGFDGEWCIFDAGYSTALYGGAATSAFPWQGVFSVIDGVAPVPTLTRSWPASEPNWQPAD